MAAGCRECGVLFASPQPAKAEVDRLYDAHGEWSDTHAGRATVRKDGPIVEALDRAIGLRRVTPAARVLDVGCGAGRWLNTFADFGWETYGIEPSTRVAFARHRQLTEIPAAPMFEVIIMHHVLEHVRRPGCMLRRCTSALEEGGWLFLSVPNLDGLPYHQDWYYCLNGRGHLAAFTHDALKMLFARVGLCWWMTLDDPQEVIECRPGSGRTRVLARRRSGQPPVVPAAAPLDAAIDVLRRSGRLLT
jgi:SAM-dependent methyltransferase